MVIQAALLSARSRIAADCGGEEPEIGEINDAIEALHRIGDGLCTEDKTDGK